MLRFFTGPDRYSKADVEGAQQRPPFLQMQCERLHLGKWSKEDAGGVAWTWSNK